MIIMGGSNEAFWSVTLTMDRVQFEPTKAHFQIKSGKHRST